MTDEKLAVVFIGFYLVLVVGVISVLSYWTDSNIDFWLTHFKGVETNCPWWLSTLATVFSFGLAIPLNILSEICEYFV